MLVKNTQTVKITILKLQVNKMFSTWIFVGTESVATSVNITLL